MTFFDSNLFNWVLLPLLIFCARIADMSLDTMRIIMIGRGRRFMAAFYGFFEVSIWLMVARQVIVHLPNPACFFAYAFGFASGNYVGLMIEERFASGAQIIRIVVNQDGARIMNALTARGYGFTSMVAEGSTGPAQMIFSIVDRRHAKNVIAILEEIEPKAFYTIEDIRYVSEGVFPTERHKRWFSKFFKQQS